MDRVVGIGALDSYILALQYVAVYAGAAITLFSLDDLVVDVWFWMRETYRALVIRRRYKPLPEQALFERAEQPIAILIPAWQEHDVIAAMIENTVNVTNYRNYKIFVGTYPNDRATIAEVDRLRRRHKRVVRVETGGPGPTSKADCLNHILDVVLREEKTTGEAYAGFVIHDCEDVVHPLELKFFNYLLPRKDLIQLPVVSLERGLRELIAGTYMDEFAEWHAKDLVVRESLAHAVPSAGVGTCFSHRAMEELTGEGRDAFNTQTLTEDYDIAARLAKSGLRTIIARYSVDYKVMRRRFIRSRSRREATLRMPLCVREYFPNTFHTSYRQKARWTIGISLQGWRQLGWSNSFWGNYFLMRDRKSLLAPILVVVGYFLFLNFLLLALFIGPGRLVFPPGLREPATLIFGFNLIALVLRVIQRMYFVDRIYGWQHALMSGPRMVAGSLVSFAATARALRIYAGHVLFDRPITWDKTAHEFPSGATLISESRRLGDILTTWEAITGRQLDAALTEQNRSHRPLGRILLSRGWLDDETLAEAIAIQSELPRAVVTADLVGSNRDRVPEDLCIRLRAAAIGEGGNGEPILAVARPLTPEQRDEIIVAVGRSPVERIVREGEVAAALRILRGSAAPEGQPPLLGDLLIERGHVTQDAFDAALESYRPDRHGRIGDHLLNTGVVTAEALAETVAEQQRIAQGNAAR
jgi:adsorption protein B